MQNLITNWKTNIEIIYQNNKLLAFNYIKLKEVLNEDFDLLKLEEFFNNIIKTNNSKVEWENYLFEIEYVPLFNFSGIDLIRIVEIEKKNEEKGRIFTDENVGELNLDKTIEKKIVVDEESDKKEQFELKTENIEELKEAAVEKETISITTQNENIKKEDKKITEEFKIDIPKSEFNVEEQKEEAINVEEAKNDEIKFSLEEIPEFKIETIKEEKNTNNDNLFKLEEPKFTIPAEEDKKTKTDNTEAIPNFAISKEEFKVEENSPKENQLLEEDNLKSSISKEDFENKTNKETAAEETNIGNFNFNIEKEENLDGELNILKEDKKVIKLKFNSPDKELDKEYVLKKINENIEEAMEELGLDNKEEMIEFFKNLLELIKDNEKEFLKAIKEQDYEKLHKIAHTLKGAALNLRISLLASILKEIDEMSRKKENINIIKNKINKFYDIYYNISKFYE